MFGEFAKYQVLPLDSSASPRFVAPRPNQAAGRKIFNYSGATVSIPIRALWQLQTAVVTDPASAFKFELFELSKDWTQYTDVSAANPKKVQEMNATSRAL